MRSRALVLAATLSLGGLLGAACSSDDDDPTIGAGAGTEEDAGAEGEGEGDAGGEEAVDEAPHNDADITFAQQMIPHHTQAIEMASLAATNASDQRVKDLAAQIEAAQAPEIEQMRAWLESWGEDAEGAAPHAGMAMSDEDMAALEAATGSEFDRMFLEMMIEHHTNAIAMAEVEIADGEFPDAVEMANAIKTSQQAEIDEMEALLEELPA